MAYIGNFDPSTVAPATEFKALPSGEYLMAVTDSEMKETKGGTGQYLQMTFTVLQSAIEEHLNRKVFVRLNLINTNPTAVEIAQRELSAICHATGVMKLQDSTQLHDLPLCCKVMHIPAKGEFQESNKISKYSPASEYGKGKPRPMPLATATSAPQPPRPMAPAVSAPRPNPPPFAAPAPAVAPAKPVAPWRAKPAEADAA